MECAPPAVRRSCASGRAWPGVSSSAASALALDAAARPALAAFASDTETGLSPLESRAALAALTEASSAAIRSISLPLSSGASTATVSLPSTLASMIVSSASRYSSLYWAGSNSPVIADTSCWAIVSSAGLKS